ncbi:MAG: HEAT repeat domain-containing protein [Gemmatimonadetes bacterium]|jgi:hypothetical protein|nr:HEAT repeat domain-containing protein [Gemmatimonadota bacterium]
MLNSPETHTLGAMPTLAEVRDYYLRTDILEELSRLTHLRDVELIYRTTEGREFHIPLEPQGTEELQVTFRRLFAPEAQLATSYYPWLHCWSNRAYEIDPGTGLRRLIGFDSGRELDVSWRRSFAEMYPGMAVLDELGIYYRLKFSGHRSLHLSIPAEAVSERYRHAPEGDWMRWRSAVNTIGEYVHHCGCGDALWSQMAAEEPFTGVYSLHRYCGLVGVPLLPSECRQFRPWMATVHLAAPIPGWWDVPSGAQENFERAVHQIRANAVVFDMDAAPAVIPRPESATGYVAPTLARARQTATAHSREQNGIALQSERVELRRLAAWCAMLLGEGLSDEALHLALQDDDDDVRWFALESRCRSEDAGISDAQLLRTVQNLAGKRQRYVRESAQELLMRSGEAGYEMLLELAGGKRQWKKDGRGPSRRRREFHELWALRQYVETDGEAAAAQLVQLADQGSNEVCKGVCAVLEKCGETGITALIKLLSSRGEAARREALVALMYNGKTTLPVLETAVVESEGEAQNLIRRIIDAATRLSKGETLCWTMRPSTLATVVALGPELAVELLGMNLLFGNRRERYHASRGLVYAGATSVTVLTDALQSHQPLVRRRASEALRDLAAPESRNPLKAALEDVDVNVRINAVRALARIGASQDRELLTSRASDPSQAVRRAIRDALGK